MTDMLIPRTGPKRIDIQKCAREGVLSLNAYVPGKPIQEVKEEFGLSEVIKLASNECPLRLPEDIFRAIQSEYCNLSRYPDGHCRKLKKKVADKLGIPEACMLFSNGAEESVMLIGQAFLNVNETGLIPAPIYDAYETSIKMTGAEVIKVPLADYHIDLEATLSLVDDRTKIIWFCSPANPTGTIIRRKEFDDFLKRLPENIIIVLDEAYFEYVQSIEAVHATDYLLKDDRVIGLRTFSKAYGLAGLRVGFIVAHPEIIKIISMVKLPFNVNVFAQTAAMAALDNTDFVKRHVDMIIAERVFLKDELSRRDMHVIPSETNFLFVEMPVDSSLLFNRLLTKGIIIRPGNIWHMPNFIRLTVGSPEENRKFLEALDRTVEELKGT